MTEAAWKKRWGEGEETGRRYDERWGGQRQQQCMCVWERERERESRGEREAVKEKMGGSITHPDWEEERTDSVIVPLTDRGGREVGMRDRRGGARGAQWRSATLATLPFHHLLEESKTREDKDGGEGRGRGTVTLWINRAEQRISGEAHFVREWTEQTARKRKERKDDRPACYIFNVTCSSHEPGFSPLTMDYQPYTF